MRAIAWMKDYKKKYDNYLNTGNANTDLNHRILLHSEGDGSDMPEIFALSQDKLQKMDKEQDGNNRGPAGPGPVPPPPPLPLEPQVQLYLNVGGQNYGPYDWATCKQLKQNNQLTPDTLVWEQGMTEWSPAGKVQKLAPLFAPPVPPAMPGMPPMPPTGATPPPVV